MFSRKIVELAVLVRAKIILVTRLFAVSAISGVADLSSSF